MSLNANHKRVLLVTLGAIDEALTKIDTLARAEASPLARHAPDLSPAQSSYVTATVVRARRRLGDLARELELGTPARRAPSSEAIGVTLLFLNNTLHDARPRRLKGYGALDAADARRVDAVLDELTTTLARVGEQLRKTSEDLGERLAALPENVAVDRELLALVDEVVTRYGLSELRGALESIVDRLENGSYEIAVFGRVSSGKSSLLNALLGQAVLPVGVTPVTAVPTRVEHGAPRVEARFADGSSESSAINALADYVSEDRNPGNARHVARVTAFVETVVLEDRLVLVDTPGVGSLASEGARESYAYLPRCDLGLVLVDASGALTADDVELMQLLLDAGIDARVLLSKADLLEDTERERLVAYLSAQLDARLTARVPVDPVSARGGVHDAGRWLAETLRPAIAELRRHRARALERKLSHVRRSVERALERAQEDEPPPSGRQRWDELTRRASASIRDAKQRADRAAHRIPERVSEVLARVAARLETEPARGVERAELLALLAGAVEAERAAVRQALIEVRDELRRLIQGEASARGVDAFDPNEVQVDLLGEPAVELASDAETLGPLAGGWTARVAPLQRRQVAAEVERARASVERAAGSLSQALRLWANAALALLDARFAAALEPLLSETLVAKGDRRQVLEDLERLRALSR
jgi:GTP-binding protein EngB required for normal cell division